MTEYERALHERLIRSEEELKILRETNIKISLVETITRAIGIVVSAVLIWCVVRHGLSAVLCR